MTTVVNCRIDKYDVYIGRGSPWGNPFIIGEHGLREAVVMKYKRWIMRRLETEPGLLEQLALLNGKRLGCYCAPLRCHGDVLVELIAEMGT